MTSVLGMKPGHDGSLALIESGRLIYSIEVEKDSFPGNGEDLSGRDDILCVGFVPLIPIINKASAVVHHGGIGTMIGAWRSACPAVVLPQAFDQAYNARIVAASGTGFDGAARLLVGALSAVLGDDRFRRRVETVATAFVPMDQRMAGDR